MKLIQYLISTFLIIILFFNNAYTADNSIYNYGPEGKNYYKLSTEKILVKFNKDLSFDQKQELLSSFEELDPISEDNLLPAPDVTLVQVQGLSGEELEDLLVKIEQVPDVIYANPFLIYEDGTYQGIQDRVIVQLKSENDFDKLNELAKEFNVNVLERDIYDSKTYILKTNKNSKGNALEVANSLHESGEFQYAEPDFLLFLKRFSTNDTYLNYQWALDNTGSSIQYSGTAGADMNVFNAWGISSGASSIKVAIIDEGVDLNHPDLIANLLSGYDATGQGSGGGPQGDDAHGTACAGIVAGVGNNNRGVAGVAYNTKIIPVRIAYSNSQGGWVTSNTWISNAINWAWSSAGADVLSNSWGGGSSSSAINSAINGAVNSGRGGLGSPVLFAAGNDNGAVHYPGTLTSVISVAAMSMCYQRKSPSSCDGETWWGSNYGTNLDIAAPGVKIFSLDISGSNGYSSGDYYSTFNGTSSATPNAAGVMALLLSANPSLTGAQARYVLESTCRKVGGYSYNNGVSGQPNGTWSSQLGYGLVDAYQALLSVAPQVANDAGVSALNSPIGSFCSSTITPELILQNYGSNTLSSVTINYAIDNTSWSTYNWTGSLASGNSTLITLPVISGISSGTHTFDVNTSNPNGQADSNPSNDAKSSNFSIANNALTLTIVLDNYGSETTWEIRNASNQTVESGGPYTDGLNGTVVTENLCVADGCFNFIIYDSYGDGICCRYGSGSYQLSEDNTGNVLASGGTFNNSETTNFCVQSTPSLTASIEASNNVSCNGGNDGFATVTASGGTQPYSYSWSNGANGATASNLSAGNYTVTVTDNNGTQATANISITQASAISFSTNKSNISCYGANNGTANVQVSGGTSPYTYLWSNNATSASISQLSAGTYSVTITDANGCTTSTSVNISEPLLLEVVASSNDVSCNGGNNGSASSFASGGTPPYLYAWNNGSNNASVSGLSAGTYSVTVTDANGCTASSTTNINEPAAISLSASTTDKSCSAINDGSIDLSVTGGVLSYTYLWSNGATTQDLNNLAAGIYTVTLTDGNGCTKSLTATVSQQSSISAAASSSDVSCNGGNDGAVNVSTAGGTSPYSYLWSSGDVTENVSGLSAGNFSVTVTDLSGCSATAATTVNEPTSLNINTSSGNISCNGADDGVASVSVSGGTSPYTYLWNNGSTSETITGLSAGSYSVTATDANGCTIQSSVGINEPTLLTSSTSPTNASCNGTSDGSVDLTVNGGTSPYTYNWSNGSSSQDLTGVSAGSYSVTVTDVNGCNTTASASINEPSAILLDVTWQNISCNGGNDGIATASATGGIAPISYLWSNGATDPIITGLSAGNYIVTVTDASGCTKTEVLTLTEPALLSILISGTDATCGQYDGSASASVSGGTSPYSYLWSNGSTTTSINALDSETYTLTVIDAQGCIASESIEIQGNCGCTYQVVNSNDFENGWGIWNSGGSDCTMNSNANYASSGTYSIQLRDNSSGSLTFTNVLNLSSYDELTISFSYITKSLSSINDDFWLEISYNGGSSYTSIEEWNYTDEFVNDLFYNDQVVISGPFTSNVRLRFRSDAAGKRSKVYLDDIVISGCSGGAVVPTCNDGIQNGDETGIDCGGSCTPCATCNDGVQNGDETGVDCGGSICSACPTCDDGIQNGAETGIDCGGPDCPSCNGGIECSYVNINSNDFENGWGIWNEGGNDCTMNSNGNNSSSGTYSIQLRDNTSGSNTFTDILDLSSYDELTIDFSYITKGMSSSSDDFWLEISSDGGNTYLPIEEWNYNDEFVNDLFYNDQVVVSGPFTSNSRLRFRSDAPGKRNKVYLDDIVIEGCLYNRAFSMKTDIDEETDFIESGFSNSDDLLNVYPNPANNYLNAVYFSNSDKQMNVAITNLLGQIAFQKQINVYKGENKLNIDLSNLSEGVYLISYIGDKNKISQKIIVTH